jgi:hypothetical protein
MLLFICFNCIFCIFWSLWLNFRHVHRACYGVLRFVMESGAKGCEVCSKVFLHLFFPIVCILPAYMCKSLQVWFSCNLSLRLLWVESLGHSVPNPWNLRMGTWYPLANLLKNILIQLLGMFFLDRSVASYVFLVDCSCSLFVPIFSWLVF